MFCINIFYNLDPDGNPHRLCFLSYRLPDGFKPVIVPHGNTKSNQPFYPTLPQYKSPECKASGPKETLYKVSAKIGGIKNASCASQLPRNERQVSYIQQKGGGTNDVDELFLLMQQAKVGDKIGLFVRENRASPKTAFNLA